MEVKDLSMASVVEGVDEPEVFLNIKIINKNV